MRRFARGISFAAALLAHARDAPADPAFPAPVAILPGSDSTVVALNVGLLVKRPDESAWTLGCTADPSGHVIGYRSDPKLPNRVLAILHDGIAMTDDLGCTWTRRIVNTGQVLDAGFDEAHPGRVWLLVAVTATRTREIWDLAEGEVVQSRLLPVGFEVDSAVVMGSGKDRRWYVAAYDEPSGSAYLLDGDSDGASWSIRPITEGTFERPRLVHVSQAPHELVVRLGGASDRLAFSNDGQSFAFSPPLNGYARALWRNGTDGFLVALRQPEGHLLLRLDPGGRLVESAPMTFGARSLDGRPEDLFGLAYALDGSPPLLESRDLGRTWSAVFDLADVRMRRDCPTVSVDCVAGCLQLAAAGFLSSAACDGTSPDSDVRGSASPSPGVLREGGGCRMARSSFADGMSAIFALALIRLGARVRARVSSNLRRVKS